MKFSVKLLCVFLGCLLFTLPGFSFDWDEDEWDAFEDAMEFSEAVHIGNVLFHQVVLQEIAYENDGHRESGFKGYDESVAYVTSQLLDAGYHVEHQLFEIPLWQETEPPLFEQLVPEPKTYPPSSDASFFTMKLSGTSDVTGVIQPVDIILPPAPDANTSTSGCEPEDFEGFIPGNIALVQRGTCYFTTKVMNAQNAGASAVIIFNEGQPGRKNAIQISLSGPDFVIPGFFAHFDIGNELYNLSLENEVSVHLMTTSITEYKEIANVIAETPYAETDNVVMVGAHLDSVRQGPGINDNGSGTAAILETAIKLMEEDDEYENKVRFAFWAAEESGLIGSMHYVNHLSDAELSKIKFYLNFDMIGSPNFVRFVYKGDGASSVPGSKHIEEFFTTYFDSYDLPTELMSLGGGSDHASFMQKGIPVGGLFTGAGALKTEEQAIIFGGTAGEPYDPYYHTAFDTVENINIEVEGEMLGAIAAAVFAGAEDEIHVPKREAVKTRAQSQPLFDFEYAGPTLIK